MFITDELGPEEVRILLKGPGILFMRDEPAARQARPA
jgi:hypothetical protein